jgi:hypothetical protein
LPSDSPAAWAGLGFANDGAENRTGAQSLKDWICQYGYSFCFPTYEPPQPGFWDAHGFVWNALNMDFIDCIFRVGPYRCSDGEIALATVTQVAVVLPGSRAVTAPAREVVAANSAKFVDVVAPGLGRASAGAGQVVRTLQTGGNKILKQTANALNDSLGMSVGRRDWGRALEELKRDLGLPGDHHGRIMSTGEYLDDSGNLLGRLQDYVP